MEWWCLTRASRNSGKWGDKIAAYQNLSCSRVPEGISKADFFAELVICFEISGRQEISWQDCWILVQWRLKSELSLLGQAAEMCLAGSPFGKFEDCHQRPRQGGITWGRCVGSAASHRSVWVWVLRKHCLSHPAQQPYKVALTHLRNVLEMMLVIQAAHSLPVKKS